MDPDSTAAKTARSLAASYGVIHACVDFATVTAVFRAARALHPDLLTPFTLIVGYDLIAFGLQYPLGAIVDRFRAARAALGVGLLVTLGSVLLIPVSGVLTMLAAGLGNALYHLGAGARVLEAAEGRAAPAGVFVAPGALGLGLGIWFGRQASAPVWPLAVLVGLCWVMARLVRGPAPASEPSHLRIRMGRSAETVSVWPAILGLLMLSVMIRSFVGFAGTYQCPKTALIAWGLPLAGCLGKLLGGFVSDRLGWLETTVGALVLSAPLLAWSGGSAYVVLPALLVFQATMPVTLTAVYLLFPTRPATAFGLPCLGLIAGAFPTFLPFGRHLYGSHSFLVLILLSALAMLISLWLLGVRTRHGGWSSGIPGTTPA
jgi:FSR family fosmidomycin resistance protein-like MFS transporter